MSGYIEVDALEEIKEIADDAFEWGVYVVKMSAIREVPTADVRENVPGEWQVYYDDSPQDGIWKCSICGYIRFVDDISPTHFCPNCGADMRKGEKDDK